MEKSLPKGFDRFRRDYPDVWASFNALGDTCHQAGGPLDEKTRRLAKLGLAIGLRHEGAVHSAARQAAAAGITLPEMMHVAVLAVTTMGWPSAYAAMTWIREATGRKKK